MKKALSSVHFEHKQLHSWMSFNAEVIYEALSSKSLFADFTSAIVQILQFDRYQSILAHLQNFILKSQDI